MREQAHFTIAVVEGLIVLAFLAGLFKTITCGAVLLMHTVSTLSSWRQYFGCGFQDHVSASTRRCGVGRSRADLDVERICGLPPAMLVASQWPGARFAKRRVTASTSDDRSQGGLMTPEEAAQTHGLSIWELFRRASRVQRGQSHLPAGVALAPQPRRRTEKDAPEPSPGRLTKTPTSLP